MAAATISSSEETPVSVNVTALIDVIFCLCVFFMCSFRFKQVEGKFDAWLPADKGPGSAVIETPKIELRVAIFWNASTHETVRRFGSRVVRDDAELQTLIREARRDCIASGASEPTVTIDAEGRVPWGAIVEVVNLCKREHVDKIEFALGLPPPR
jgi:biopolymer transport protein ExbD